MKNLYLSYIDLSPEIDNIYSTSSHQIIIKNLRENYLNWNFFFEKFPGYSIGFIITTKKDIEKLTVNGPSIFKKEKVVDFAIFLPTIISCLDKYIDLVFEGFFIALVQYNISIDDINKIKETCKEDLNNNFSTNAY